jgi:hypothetical protein
METGGVRIMGRWCIENRTGQQVLTHYCSQLRGNDSNQILRQDIGGGYIRCERCKESYLPEAVAGNPRLLLRVTLYEQTEESVLTSVITAPAAVPSVTAVVAAPAAAPVVGTSRR